MPYRDVKAQRKARRESAARTRARARRAEPVEPDVEPSVEPASEPTWDELQLVGRLLLVGPLQWGETLPEYRERIHAQWQWLKRVIGEAWRATPKYV